MVGTQAVLNVLLGERYKVVPKEIKDYVRGYYGSTPAQWIKSLQKEVWRWKEVVLVDRLQIRPNYGNNLEKKLKQNLRRRCF